MLLQLTSSRHFPNYSPISYYDNELSHRARVSRIDRESLTKAPVEPLLMPANDSHASAILRRNTGNSDCSGSGMWNEQWKECKSA